MPYRWPLDPQELFRERHPQMINNGLPAADIDAVRTAVTDMWVDAPGGWVHEWSEIAARPARRHAGRAGQRRGRQLEDGLARRLGDVRRAARRAGFGLRHSRHWRIVGADGADDVHVPQHDTLVFQGRRDTTVELVPGTGHCATTRLPQAMATIADWLKTTLAVP